MICTLGVLVYGESKTSTNVDELDFNMEEADSKIILHIYWYLNNFYRCTNVIVDCRVKWYRCCNLLLFYIDHFMKCGLAKLWLHFGNGQSACYLPLRVRCILYLEFNTASQSWVFIWGQDASISVKVEPSTVLSLPTQKKSDNIWRISSYCRWSDSRGRKILSQSILRG